MWMGLGTRRSLVPLCAGKGQGVECWDLVSLGCELWDTFSWNLVPSELCEEWRERVIFGPGQHSSDGTGLAVTVSCQPPCWGVGHPRVGCVPSPDAAALSPCRAEGSLQLCEGPRDSCWPETHTAGLEAGGRCQEPRRA